MPSNVAQSASGYQFNYVVYTQRTFTYIHVHVIPLSCFWTIANGRPLFSDLSQVHEIPRHSNFNGFVSLVE